MSTRYIASPDRPLVDKSTEYGTGLQSVTEGVADVPRTLADRIEDDAENLRDAMGLGTAATSASTAFAASTSFIAGAGALTGPAAPLTIGTIAAAATGDYLPIGGGTLTGHLTFTDNTYDIGATAATRPRTLYLGTQLRVQATTNQQVIGASTNLTTVNYPASSGAVTVTMPNVAATVAYSSSALTTGRVVFTTTNGVLTDSANLTWNGTTLAITGAVTVSSTLAVTGAGTFTGLLTANGGIQSGTGAGEVDVVSANGALLGIRTAEATITGMSGATVTASNLIPAGSYVHGVTVRNTTATSHTYNVGDGTDADAWGAAIAATLYNTTTSADFNITGLPFYKAATSVVLTSIGGNFSSGAVRVVVHYSQLTGPTA